MTESTGSSLVPSPPDGMVTAALHVRARWRRREGAEVERQRPGGWPRRMSASKSIKHLGGTVGGERVVNWGFD